MSQIVQRFRSFVESDFFVSPAPMTWRELFILLISLQSLKSAIFFIYHYTVILRHCSSLQYARRVSHINLSRGLDPQDTSLASPEEKALTRCALV